MESHILQTVNILVENLSRSVSQLTKQVDDMGNTMSIMKVELEELKKSSCIERISKKLPDQTENISENVVSGRMSTEQVLEKYGHSQASQPYLMKQNGAIAPARFGMIVKQPDQIRKAMDNAQKAAEAVAKTPMLVEKTKNKEIAKKIKFRNNSIMLILLPDFQFWTPELRSVMMGSKFCITIQDDYFTSIMSADVVIERLIKLFLPIIDLGLHPFAWCSLKGSQSEITPLNVQNEDCYKNPSGKQLHTFTDSGGSKGAVLLIKLLNEPDEDHLKESELATELRSLLAEADDEEEHKESEPESDEIVDRDIDEILPRRKQQIEISHCGTCNKVVPPGIAQRFLAAQTKAETKLANGNLSFNGQAEIISELCDLHNEYEFKALGRKNNWPLDSYSFEKDSKWIVQKEAAEKLSNIVRDPTISVFFTRLIPKEPRREGERRSARVGAGTTTILIPRVKKRKLMLDLDDSVHYMPGYYGDQGYFMFSHELAIKFSAMINDVGLAKASGMSTLDFVQMVLVPEACVLLFQKRLHSISRESALKLRADSVDFGRFMFPKED